MVVPSRQHEIDQGGERARASLDHGDLALVAPIVARMGQGGDDKTRPGQRDRRIGMAGIRPSRPVRQDDERVLAAWQRRSGNNLLTPGAKRHGPGGAMGRIPDPQLQPFGGYEMLEPCRQGRARWRCRDRRGMGYHWHGKENENGGDKARQAHRGNSG
jgi:hypothetical protein